MVDYIISEDSDLLVFGNPQYTKVIYKFNFDNNHRKKFHTLIRIFLGFFPRVIDFFQILGKLYHFLNLGKKLNLGSQTQNLGSKLGLAFSHFLFFSRNCFVLN